MNEQRAVAIVTGAASGIGKSVAKLYAQNGIAVVLSDVNQDPGEQGAEHIRQAGGRATFVASHVSKSAVWERRWAGGWVVACSMRVREASG